MQMSYSSPRAVFAHFETKGGQQLPEAQLVGRMLLQRLATGSTGVTSNCPRRGYEDIYYTRMRSIRTYVSIVYDVLQFVCIEFRRGFLNFSAIH